MRLSTSLKCFLLTALIVLAFAACWQSAEPTGAPAAEPRPGQFPFSTVEPAVYQTTVEVRGEGVNDRWFVAKRNDRWRVDFYDSGELASSLVRSDALYRIDHRKKVYFPLTTAGGPSLNPADRFFRHREYRRFERVGEEGQLTRFRVTSEDGPGVVDLLVDEKNGLVLREEFRPAADAQPNFTYEMKDLTLSVDDQVFAFPAGYRRLNEAPQTKDE